jgi:hypothetical protein
VVDDLGVVPCTCGGDQAMSPINLSQLLDDQDREDDLPAAPRPHSMPLLDAWPPGYENATFRLDGDDVLISAKGKRTLRIKGTALSLVKVQATLAVT